MRLRLLVTAEAERQIRAAAVWWRENRRAAPRLFRQELTRGFELITSQPNLGPRALDTDLQEVRRVHLYRVGYYLYYQVHAEAVREAIQAYTASLEEDGLPVPADHLEALLVAI